MKNAIKELTTTLLVLALLLGVIAGCTPNHAAAAPDELDAELVGRNGLTNIYRFRHDSVTCYLYGSHGISCLKD